VQNFLKIKKKKERGRERERDEHLLLLTYTMFVEEKAEKKRKNYRLGYRTKAG